jgi:hypothetical protein
MFEKINFHKSYVKTPNFHFLACLVCVWYRSKIFIFLYYKNFYIGCTWYLEPMCGTFCTMEKKCLTRLIDLMFLLRTCNQNRADCSPPLDQKLILNYFSIFYTINPSEIILILSNVRMVILH